LKGMDCKEAEKNFDDAYFLLLDEETEHRFRRHLADCPTCREKFGEREGFWTRLKDAGASVGRPPLSFDALLKSRTRPILWKRLLAGALIAASVLLLILLFYLPEEGRVMPWTMKGESYEFRVEKSLETDIPLSEKLLPRMIGAVVEVATDEPLDEPQEVIIRLNGFQKKILLSDVKRIEFPPEVLKGNNRLSVNKTFEVPVRVTVFINWSVDETHQEEGR